MKLFLLITFGKSKKCTISVTSRACRSHLPTQACLTYIYQHNKEFDISLLEAIRKQENWSSLISMEPYKKNSVNMAANVTRYQFASTLTREQDLLNHQQQMLTEGLIVKMSDDIKDIKFDNIDQLEDILYYIL